MSHSRRAGGWVRRIGVAGAASVLVGGLSLLTIGEPASAAMSVTTIARSSWAYVDSRTPDTTHLNPTGDAPVGTIHASGGDHTYRSYFTFDVSGFRGRQIGTVTLFAPETEATDCVHRSVELWTTAPVTAHSTWKDQPAWQQKIYTAGYLANTTCPFPRVEWDATTAVRQAVAAGQSQLTLGLRATDEGEPKLGRWFANNVLMTITYDTPPDTPTPAGTDGKACATATPYPWVASLRPTLSAKLTDPDGTQDGVLDVTFALWPVDDPANRTTLPGPGAGDGQTTQLRLPAGVIADGGSYGWSAQATDAEGLTSGWSTACYFQVDATAPANPPTVSSNDYPDDGHSHGGQGIPGTFTFSANGVADVVGFEYAWYGGPPAYVAADQLGGTASVTLAPPSIASNLTVWSIDRAGNFSPQVYYRITTAPTTPIVTSTGQPKAGGTIQLDFQPGVKLAGYQVVSYTYSVNDGANQTVAARADGTATASVPLEYGANTVKVRSTSTNGWISPESDSYFYADNSPTIASADFPESGDGGAVGKQGTFTFSSNLADSTTFFYSFDYGSTWQTVPVGPGGQATINWTPTMAGSQALYAYSQTADGTQSDWYFYDFSVNG